MKKEINTLTSIIIILIVLCAFIFLALGFEKAKLSASISATQFNPITLSQCYKEAYENFCNQWNQECFSKGLEEKCSLPKEIATELKSEYQGLKNNCQ